jgi:hypothetical protein
VKWPGAIHEGGGEGVLLIDERATDSQRLAIEKLLEGKIGGPWGILAWTWPTIHGPYAVPYEVSFNGTQSTIKSGDNLEITCGPIRNPVTGNESHPEVVLPQGIIFKHGHLGVTTKHRLSRGIDYDHTGKYMGVGPFNYSYP